MPKGVYKRTPDMKTGKYKRKPFTEKHKENLSKSHLGNIGFWKGKNRSKETIKKMSDKLRGKKRPPFSKEWKENISKASKGKPKPWLEGKNNPAWQDGISFEPYSIDWTKTLKRSIRERDHYTCQLCGVLQSDRAFDVHHIDYNKKNCNPTNLTTLCHSCNARVNGDRGYWTKYFKGRLKIITK